MVFLSFFLAFLVGILDEFSQGRLCAESSLNNELKWNDRADSEACRSSSRSILPHLISKSMRAITW